MKQTLEKLLERFESEQTAELRTLIGISCLYQARVHLLKQDHLLMVLSAAYKLLWDKQTEVMEEYLEKM